MTPHQTARRSRWRLAIATAVAAGLLAITACSGSSLGGSDSGGEEIRIGLIVPKSGPYKAIGDDQAAGWRLALDKLGGRLGGRPVRVIEADEGDGKATALAAARKLIEQDKVLALVGGATADTVQTLYPLLNETKVPLIGIGGRPSTVEDPTYLWSTSWLSQETGASIATYLVDRVGDGRVWVIGPDYIGGHDQINGFVDAFRKAGGQLANPDGKPTWTPWAPAPTTEFSPYLTQIKQAAPAAVYTFYAGASAIEFVKQYRQYGVDIPLYASGFLTEGAPLAALGEQAKGVYTALNYSTTLDKRGEPGLRPPLHRCQRRKTAEHLPRLRLGRRPRAGQGHRRSGRPTRCCPRHPDLDCRGQPGGEQRTATLDPSRRRGR